MKFMSTALFALATSFAATAALADPADCWSVTGQGSIDTFNLAERQVNATTRKVDLHFLSDWALAEGVMPAGNYTAKHWSGSEYRLDVDSYFPNTDAQSRGTFMYFLKLSDDGMNSKWALRVVQFTDGISGGSRILMNETYRCLDE